MTTNPIVGPFCVALAMGIGLGFALGRREMPWKRLAFFSLLIAWLTGIAANLPVIIDVHGGSDPVMFLGSIILIPAVVLASIAGFSVGVALASPVSPIGRRVHVVNAVGLLPVVILVYGTNILIALAVGPPAPY